LAAPAQLGVVVDEIRDQRGRLAAISACLRKLGSDLFVRSRDQPSAVLKATMQTGDEYWSSSRRRVSVDCSSQV
jgi:hypothetical protein